MLIYSFRPATRADLMLLRGWRAQPHVIEWWGDPLWKNQKRCSAIDGSLGGSSNMKGGRSLTRKTIAPTTGRGIHLATCRKGARDRPVYRRTGLARSRPRQRLRTCALQSPIPGWCTGSQNRSTPGQQSCETSISKGGGPQSSQARKTPVGVEPS